MVSKLVNNKIVKNASWLVIGKCFQVLIEFLVLLITARYLGPSNYGLINYAAAYTAFFYSICTLGINSIIVKEFVDYPNKEGEIIGTTLLLRLIISIISFIIIYVIVYIIDSGDKLTLIVVSLCCIGMIFQIFETFNYWFQSKLQSKVTAIIGLLAYFIMSVYKIVLVITGKSVAWFAFAKTLDYVFIAIFLFIAYKKYDGSKLKFSYTRAKNLFEKSHHFIITAMMTAVYAQTDKIMLKLYYDEASTGYYTTATTICLSWCFILSAIIDSVYPEIAKKYNIDKAQFEKLNKQLYAIVFYISVIVSFFITVFSELVVKILYGEVYLPAAQPLKIITWYTAFAYIGVARNIWVVCKNKQKYLKYVYIGSSLLNVILNFLFIPYMGINGAAWASLISQISTIIIPFFIKDLRENSILILKAILFI